MNIVYNCNERFAGYTAVSITSLFENNRDIPQIRVYILGNGLSAGSISRFQDLAAGYQKEGRERFGSPGPQYDGPAAFVRSVQILDLENYESVLRMLFGSGLNTGGFDLTVLARLFAPSHLPDDVERYIYLDADTIVTGSIRELWETDLKGCICAMAPEPTIYQETRNRLGIADTEPYFNSGMILTDRLRWEEERITAACIDYYGSVGGSGLSFPDQDILNVVLKGRILPVWQGWNFFSNYHYRSYRSLVKHAGWYGNYMTEKEYARARSKPAVVHFAGGERPWIRGSCNPYKHAYRVYLAKSPWKGMRDIGGQELEMLAYHMTNMLTLYCPPARELISSLYYRYKIQNKH